jgi:tripartite-type tricarboxylate transporter receptor subunit TctC
VTIVVPYPAGGSNDVFAREISRKLSDAWKVPVVVENRAGAAGSIGASIVAHARPDGYTLCLLSSSFATGAAIRARLPYDPVKDFAAVAMVARGPMLLTVRNDLPVHTTLELFDYARRNPGQLTYASSGVGSNNHFATELLMDAAQIRMTHVPYKGMSPAVTDVIGGRVDVLIASAPSIYQQVRAGRVRALGITSAKPSSVVPGLEPLAQMGVPGYAFEPWWGMLAPAKTPAAVVHEIHSEVTRIVSSPEMAAVFAREGAEPATMSEAQFAATIASGIERWKRVAKDADIRPE